MSKDFQEEVSRCTWPHRIESPILVYDRDFYKKYECGEFEVPKRCVCGALIDYAEPICICLVEKGVMTGEMIVKVPIPLTHIQLNLVTDVGAPTAVIDWKGSGLIGASMGCTTSSEPCKLCNPDVQRISVRCKHSGRSLYCMAVGENYRWSCPCGSFYEKSASELPLVPDEVVIDEHCRGKKK